MKCNNHPEVDAVGSCVYCGKLFCSSCLVDVGGKNYCKADVTKVLEESKAHATKAPYQKVVIQSTTPTATKSGLKVAVKVLMLIFGIIGIMWGFSGPILAGCSAVAVAVAESSSESQGLSSTATSLAGSAAKLLGSLVFIVAGMVLGLIASSSKTRKTTTIVLGSLVVVMGVISTILMQYVSGPVYVLSGILALVAGLKQKEYSSKN